MFPFPNDEITTSVGPLWICTVSMYTKSFFFLSVSNNDVAFKKKKKKKLSEGLSKAKSTVFAQMADYES